MEAEQIVQYQAELKRGKTPLEIDNLNVKLTELGVESSRKRAALAAVLNGVLITLSSALNKLPEASSPKK